jgi:hypothetical protein
MKDHTHTCTLLSSIVVLAVVALTGTNLRADQQQLAASIKEARVEATRTHDQLGATLSALNALTKQSKGDLRASYTAFAAEIPKTDATATSTRARVTRMEADGLKYFGGWQKEVDSIANESLRKKAQKRLNAAKSSYDKVSVALSKGAEKFNPFLSDLTDIQKTLANDVTPAGVKAIRSTVTSANWNFKYVNNAVNDALKEMEKMERALSPEVQ